jgi:magnesium transporter
MPVARRGESVGDLVSRVRVGADTNLTDCPVLDGEAVFGLIPVGRLLAARADGLVDDLCETELATVPTDASPALAAHVIARNGGRTLVVVEPDGTFVGLIPPEQMVALLSAEHEEDLARLGGYLHRSDQARSAAEEPLARRLWHRLPWLLVGLVGAFAATTLVGSFEEELNANVLIAFFVPAVVYMAAAVGVQTETVLIRGLSAGVRPLAVFGREVATGMVAGMVVGVLFFAFAALGWGDTEIAAGVGVALFASCSVATLIAIILPTSLQRLGLDPAFGSGPLATVLEDLLTIAVYFTILSAIVD